MLSGIILAGGLSRRMGGENKSLLMLGGETLIERQVRILRERCSEVIIVTNTPRAFLRKVDESVRIITDYIPKKGPLSGMHAGLTLSQNQNAWIVACDMPFLSLSAVDLMLSRKEEGMEAVIPVIQDSMQPLHAIYDRNCAQKIGALLMSNHNRLQSLGRTLKWQAFAESEFRDDGLGAEFVKAIKTHEEYNETIRLISSTITI